MHDASWVNDEDKRNAGLHLDVLMILQEYM